MANNLVVKGGLVANSITGSLLGTASFAASAVTASYALTANTASYALIANTASYVATASYATLAATASFINNLKQNLTITGSLTTTGNVIVQGDIIAKNYIVSSSVSHFTESFSSGSTRFGDSSDDTHQFTGSILAANGIDVSGSARFFQSVQVTGSMDIVGAVTASALSIGALTTSEIVSNHFTPGSIPSQTIGNVYDFEVAKYEGAVVDLLIKSSNGDMRLSTIMVVADGGGSIKYNESSTEDIGDTTDLVVTCTNNGTMVIVQATNNSSIFEYDVRPFPRLIQKFTL
jgi:hypothetical protein